MFTCLLYIVWAVYLNLISLYLSNDNSDVKTLEKCLVPSTMYLLLFSSLLFFPLLLSYNKLVLSLQRIWKFQSKGKQRGHGYLREMLTTACRSLWQAPAFWWLHLTCLFPTALLDPSHPKSTHFLQPDFCSSFWSQVKVTSLRAWPLDKVRSPWLSKLSLQHFSSCK